MFRSLLYFLGIIILVSCTQNKLDQSNKSLNDGFTISLGSCYKTTLNDNSMWQEVVKNKPDLWIWLGDIVYADTEDMSVMNQKYDALKYDTEYQKLVKSTDVIGIWDDHDYGVNDGGKDYSKKDESKLQLMNFLDVDASNSVYKHDGIYTSFIYGSGEKSVKVILLDTRYFRDELERDNESDQRYKINSTGDILGDSQWKWLEEELNKNEAAIHIIASGYQVIAWEPKFEKWSNFPTARNRLFDLLVKTNPNRAFLLSGDRHISEVAKMEIEGLNYPLYEFTCSGITHTWSEEWPEENRYRETDLIIKKNFGIINVDWNGDSPNITFEIRGKGNQLFSTYSPKF